MGDPGETSAALPGPGRRRAALVLAGAVVVGLAIQLVRDLPGSDVAGTLAYGVAAVGLAGVLWPRRGALLPGVVGTGAATAVELAQLTGIPAALAAHVPAVSLLLGRSFDPVDVITLVAGGAVATVALASRSHAHLPGSGPNARSEA
ncbi:DUF2809 domain-containing protein [Beutenbergia cavernae]|uniref:DUF2809 domain-containing protein n=1 Tax=Beutenbergia cavernae TaxID=84757 RepID=UPI00019ACF7F|nr:DUF2809 domain-containing protein [Beutenbergia cavernae]